MKKIYVSDVTLSAYSEAKTSLSFREKLNIAQWLDVSGVDAIELPALMNAKEDAIICRTIAGDGEGATKLLECTVSGADTLEAAKTAAKSVICSSLLKAAMFGADANWGRVLCAIGYSGADVDVSKVDVSFRSAKGEIIVCKDGAGVPFSEEIAKEILLEKEIDILISVGDGPYTASAWGCDLTYDYVKINGDYRT
jgi:glutamate N-acetyltransferase/amino-acid N-acetyltransferase